MIKWKPELSIEEMAYKHLNRHPNDKSKRILARMNRKFGRVATNKAIKKMHQTILLVNPNRVLTKDDLNQRYPWEFEDE